MPWAVIVAFALLAGSVSTVSFDPAGGSVSAVEWTFTGVPAGFTVSLNPALADKSLACGPVANGQQTCLVSGLNQDPIPAGPLVSTSAPVPVSQGNAAGPDGSAQAVTVLNPPATLTAIAQ